MHTAGGTLLDGHVRSMGSGLFVSLAPRTGQQSGSVAADASRAADPRRTEADTAEAEMARVASRLQAVLSSAVELDASIQDAERIYHTAFENLSAAIPFDTGVIQMLSEDRLRIVAAWGFPGDSAVTDIAFPLDDRFPNVLVVNSRRALALDDIRVDFPHFLDQDGQYESRHIRSWLGVPLLDRGTVVGMITMDRSEVRPFDPDEIEIAQALANHAAVALSNARMYESLERANNLQHLLLRELHHRVKNSLQLVSSMMSLRIGELDEPTASLIQDLRTHIQALAATHDNIFQPGLSQDVLLTGYLEDVARSVQLGYALRPRGIDVEVEIPAGTRCSMDTAIPLGLMLSELVLNASKHAFTGQQEGSIRVQVLESDTELQLTVADTGIGFAEASPTTGGGFGLNLVSMLAEQIDASVGRVSDAAGTVWTIIVAKP